MKKSTVWTIVIVVIIIIIALVAYAMRPKSSDLGQTATTTPQNGNVEDQQSVAAENAVVGLGQQLNKVSLLAPDASSTMEEFYGPYVAPDLLAKWEADPSKAPGKQTSSPWPDHIQVTDVQKNGDAYAMQGQIVLMTSNEVEHGGIAGVQDFTATVSNVNGQMLITDFTLGQFSSGGAS